MTKKIGLLLPKSVLYQSMSFDIMGGLKAGLESKGDNDVEIKTESIGVGADDKLIYALCEKLLLDGAGVIAGYINPSSAEKLQPLFASANAILITLDAGYHFPLSGKKLEHVFNLSLQGTHCCRTVTKTACDHGAGQMAFACSFYDSGYRSAYAIGKALEDGGGAVTFNLVTQLKRSEFTLQPLEEHVKTGEPKAVFASFCGDMLQDFYNGVVHSDAFGDCRIYGSSFAGEEQWLAKCLYPGTDVTVCVPWASSLELDANIQFKDRLKKNKTNINIFSLLGWETALILSALQKAESTEDAISILEHSTFESPRGTLKMDNNCNKWHAPIYEAMVKEDEATGNCMLSVNGVAPDADAQWHKLQNDINNLPGSMASWLNAYPCLES